MSDEKPKLQVLDIPPRDEAIQKRVEEMLVAAMETARQRGAVGVMVVVELADGNTTSFWTPVYDDYFRRMGALESLKLRWWRTTLDS
jgi:hypothetical protein